MDVAIIGAAQRVEHYEIAAYGTTRELARLLGEDEHVPLLEQTLNEEKQTDERLTQLAGEINSQALEAGKGVGDSQGEEGEGKRRTRSSSRHAA
jgi:ferritin-like metal-binding protein YciE